MATTRIAVRELFSYHSIDRDIFHLMVSSLGRDLAETMMVIAIWLWLEEMGYPNIIMRLLTVSAAMVDLVADEAVAILRCLQSSHPPHAENGGMTYTNTLTSSNITLQMFYQNRFTAITGIKNILNTVCSRIFTDKILSKMVEQGHLKLQDVEINQPLAVPGFPHALFGAVQIVPRTMDFVFPTGAMWGWGLDINVSDDDRTMFLTFSRGFPVRETEVRELFTRVYGDCVQAVHMQETALPDEQPLFARLVLRSITTVDSILCGRRVAKFRINGKHIWARKYERRD